MSPALPPRISAITGSGQPGSLTRAVANVVAAAAARAGVEVGWIDLSEWQLPIAARSKEGIEAAERLRRCVSDAFGLLVATPVYNDSYSGLLKHALDLIGAEGLGGKWVALVSVGGGRFGHDQALVHLRSVLSEAGAHVLSRQVALANSHALFDGTELRDPEIAQRLESLGLELSSLSGKSGKPARVARSAP
jgi:NAD(P)H-dependent FMN reductase